MPKLRLPSGSGSARDKKSKASPYDDGDLTLTSTPPKQAGSIDIEDASGAPNASGSANTSAAVTTLPGGNTTQTPGTMALTEEEEDDGITDVDGGTGDGDGGGGGMSVVGTTGAEGTKHGKKKGGIGGFKMPKAVRNLTGTSAKPKKKDEDAGGDTVLVRFTEMEEENQKLRTKIFDLENEIKQKEDEYQNLQDMYAINQAKLADLRDSRKMSSDLIEANEKIGKLTKQEEDLKMEIEDLKNDIKKLKENNQDFDQKLRDAQNELELLKSQKIDLEMQLMNANDQVKRADSYSAIEQAEDLRLRSERDGLVNQLKATEDELNLLKSKYRDAQTELEKANEELRRKGKETDRSDDLQRRLSQAAQETASLNEANLQLEARLNEASKSLKAAIEEKDALQKSNEDLQLHLERLRARETSESEAEIAWKAQIDQIRSKHNKAIEELNERILALEEEKESSKYSMKILEGEKNELQAKIEKLNREVENAKALTEDASRQGEFKAQRLREIKEEDEARLKQENSEKIEALQKDWKAEMDALNKVLEETRKELSETRKELSDKNESSEQMNKELNEKLTEKDEFAKGLEVKIEKQSEEEVRLNDKLTAMATELNGVRENLERAQKEKLETENLLKGKQDEMSAALTVKQNELRQELAEQRDKILVYETENAQLRKDKERLTEARQKWENDYTKLNLELSELKTEQKQLLDETTRLKDQEKVWKTVTETVNGKLEEVKKRNAEAEAQIKDLQSQVEFLSRSTAEEKNSLSMTLSDKAREIEKTKEKAAEEISRLYETIQELKAQAKANQEVLVEKSANLVSANAELQRANERVAKLDSELKALLEQRAENSSKATARESAQERELLQLQSRLTISTEKLESAQTRLADLIKENKELKEERQNGVFTTDNLRKELTETQAELQIAKKHLADVRAENADLKENNEELKKTSASVWQESLKSSQQNSTDINTLRSKLQSAEKSNSQLKREITQETNRVNELEMTNRQLISEKERMKNLLDERSEQLEMTHGRLAEADLEIQRLKTNVNDAFQREAQMQLELASLRKSTARAKSMRRGVSMRLMRKETEAAGQPSGVFNSEEHNAQQQQQQQMQQGGVGGQVLLSADDSLKDSEVEGLLSTDLAVAPNQPAVAVIYSDIIAHSESLPKNVRIPEGVVPVVNVLKRRLEDALFESQLKSMSSGRMFGDHNNDLSSLFNGQHVDSTLEVQRVLPRMRRLWKLSEDLRLALVQSDPSLAARYQATKTASTDWDTTLDIVRESASVVEERNRELEDLVQGYRTVLESVKTAAKQDREQAKAVVLSLRKQLKKVERMRVAATEDRQELLDEITRLREVSQQILFDRMYQMPRDSARRSSMREERGDAVRGGGANKQGSRDTMESKLDEKLSYSQFRTSGTQSFGRDYLGKLNSNSGGGDGDAAHNGNQFQDAKQTKGDDHQGDYDEKKHSPDSMSMSHGLSGEHSPSLLSSPRPPPQTALAPQNTKMPVITRPPEVTVDGGSGGRVTLWNETNNISRPQPPPKLIIPINEGTRTTGPTVLKAFNHQPQLMSSGFPPKMQSSPVLTTVFPPASTPTGDNAPAYRQQVLRTVPPSGGSTGGYPINPLALGGGVVRKF